MSECERTDQCLSVKTSYLLFSQNSIIVLSTVVVTPLQSIQQVDWSPLTLLNFTLILSAHPGHSTDSTVFI